MWKGLLVAAIVLTAANSGFGESALETCRQEVFEYLDRNSDGVLTPAEAARRPMGMNAKFFAMSDINGNGVLEHREYLELGIFIDCEMCPAGPGCAKAR